MNKDGTGKILGVIGGMGPLATQLFYKMIIEKTDAHCDQDHINMIILSHATMPDRTTAIKGGDTEDLFSLLLADGKMLEENGATSIAIPCNTSHLLADRLQEGLNIPIIHMIRETVTKICQVHRRESLKIGILATDGTIETKLYQKECEEAGIEPFIPSRENQKRIMKIIYDGIKNGGPIDYTDFMEVERELKLHDCDAAIMGCTELSCFKEQWDLPSYYMDAMAILAERAIISCDKKVKG